MRADIYLVHHGYYESRARAQAAIKAGLVMANGKALKKPSDKIADDAVIKASHEHAWVSRGGVKLAHALDVFGVNVSGKICLDVGASTGGFTDVLLQGGARHIYAVDVGHDQLHARLQGQDRITSLEGCDARVLTSAQIPQAPNIIVCDASFISAMKILPVPLSLAAPRADLITLVKPQFEVGRAGLGRGGLVKDPSLAKRALLDIEQWVENQGWSVLATDCSPITGGDGNREYLLHARLL